MNHNSSLPTTEVKTLPMGPRYSSREWHVDQRLGFSTYGFCAWWLQAGIRLERWACLYSRVLEKTSACLVVCEQETVRMVLGDDWSQFDSYGSEPAKKCDVRRTILAHLSSCFHAGIAKLPEATCCRPLGAIRACASVVATNKKFASHEFRDFEEGQ